MFNGTAVMRTTRVAFALIGAVGLILTLLGTPPASAGRAAPAAAAVSWSRVTPVGTNIIDDIGLARGTDGVLHVLWKTDASSNPQILDFPVSPTGTVGAPATVARFFLASDPDATVTPTGIAALWNGASQETGGTQGAFEATRPLSGGHWAMTAHVPPAQNVVWSSLTVAATTGSDGKPWSAFTGTDSLAVVHFPHGMVQLGPTNMCCVDMPGLGTDGSTGSTWVTYSSLISKHEGIFARKLLASGQPAGPATHLPGSSVGGLSVQPEQRVATTGRWRLRRVRERVPEPPHAPGQPAWLWHNDEGRERRRVRGDRRDRAHRGFRRPAGGRLVLWQGNQARAVRGTFQSGSDEVRRGGADPAARRNHHGVEGVRERAGQHA